MNAHDEAQIREMAVRIADFTVTTHSVSSKQLAEALYNYGYRRREGLRPLDETKIICLVGSTRFVSQYIEQYNRLSSEGNIVLFLSRVNATHIEPDAKAVQLHLKKTRLADEVFCLNVGGYVGDTTRDELNYAIALGKTIKFLEPIE